MSDQESRTRLAAILAADAAGFSRLMAVDDLGTVAALDAARTVFRGQIEAHQGRVIDMAGDSVLAVFETVTGAVAAALAVQAQLNPMAEASPEGRRLWFRIGVHLGDVIEKLDGTIYGDGVNIAARLQALARAGGVTVSDAVRGAVRTRVQARFIDLGARRVKNIDEPVRVFALEAAASPDAGTPVPTTTGPLRFGRFELQPHARLLLVDGNATALGTSAFDLLVALAARAGRLVGNGELMALVWPGQAVAEHTLAAHMSELGKVLGGDLIATIPGRGYRFMARIEPVATAAPRSGAAGDAAAGLRTNLPAELPTLLGRTDDLAVLSALIDRHRLVSIVGPGGIGKSLLAQHLLRIRRDSYAQGVCWVEVAPALDSAALPGAVATALGVPGGRGDPLAALIALVTPLNVLLVLDNAEHLLGDVARLCQKLFDAAPGLHLIVTSQAPLKLAAEHVYRIGPLAVPQTALNAAQAAQFGAVALFVERAQAAESGFALDDTNAPAVIAVCRSLDGLPLAIELAAARAPLLGMRQLASSMHERLRLLTSSRNRVAPARQRTLRAALEWSHGFLQPREQLVFRRLGVMAGSASLPLIQQVVADVEEGGELDAWAVLDSLDVLVDRSLVSVVTAEDEGDVPRYRLLGSLRVYALERLDQSGERDAVQRRHALALAAMFEAAYDEYFDGRVDADAWLRCLEHDFDNARDALAWARTADDAQVELTIGATLLRALWKSMHAERMALADACESRMGHSLPGALQQRAWLELSNAWADTQKLRSRDAADRALRLARQLDHALRDRFVLYHALCRFASATAQAGDPSSAAAPLAELQGLEDPTWPAHRLLWGAEAAMWVARMGGDSEETLRRSREVLGLERARGSDPSVVLDNLVDHELAAGDAAGAARSGRTLVASLQGTRDEYGLAFARLNLCAALLALGDLAQARPVAQAAWPQAVAFELQHAAAAYLALLAALEDRPRSAAQLLGYARATYAARQEVQQTNEATAMARAQAVAEPALGEAEFGRAHAEGATLRDADIAELAFDGERG